jgi:hypothetical protein
METKIKSETKIVGPAYVENWRGDLFCLIKEYFKQSGDKASTPGAVLLDIVDHIDTKDFVLIVHEVMEFPVGFMIGKKVNSNARILLAFLGRGLDSKAIIKEALELFEQWARERRCTALDLYTHRHPKSYKSLEQYGWRHSYTVYRKELGETP